MKKINLFFLLLCFFIIYIYYYYFKKNIYTFAFWDEIILETNKHFVDDPNMYKKKKYQLIHNRYLKKFVDKLDTKLNEQIEFSDFEIKDENNYKQPIYFEKVKIKNDSQVVIIGDIHSSLHSFFAILKSIRSKYFEKEFILKKDHYIIFLGDFVDRGPFSTEILVLIFMLKIENFNNVFITQGNHENLDTNSVFGLKTEMYHQGSTKQLFLKTNSVLNKFPEALFVEYCNKFFMCCHGVFDIEDSYLYINDFLKSGKKYFLQKILKDNEVSGYKWNDINMETATNTINKRGTEDVSEAEILKYFLQTGVCKIFKGHQDQEPCNIGILSNTKTKQKYNVQLSKIYKAKKLYNPKQMEFDFFDNNLLAFITSTATQSKNLNINHSFLEITNQKIKVHLVV